MYTQNGQHLQALLLSGLDQLSKKSSKLFHQSWAGVCYCDFFCSLDELPFVVLFPDAPARPILP
jgi:hypothetical protein